MCVCVCVCQVYSYICWCVACGFIYRLCRITCRVSRGICKVWGRSCHALRCIAWSEGIYECQCFRNELEHTETHMPVNTSCQHDFAALHGLCMLKVSTIYVLVVEVTRHNIRNVLRMTLLSLGSTVSQFLKDLQSTLSCVCCQLYHSNEHPVPRKRVNLGKNINYSSVNCFKAAVIDICLQEYGKNDWF